MMDKLRDKLAALKLGGCVDCAYGCWPPNDTLCPADLDQVMLVFAEWNNET